MKKTVYNKLYNRALPLICVQYWGEADYNLMPKFTEGAARFNPLFIHEKGKAVDIYYYINHEKRAVLPLINYFKKNPDKFANLAVKYQNDCNELLKLCQNKKLEDFSKIRNKVLNIWPMISITMILGKLIKEKGVIGKIAREAYDLRIKNEKVVYEAGDALYYIAKEKFPELEEYLDFLTFEETNTGQPPTLTELKKRVDGFIFFKGKLYTDKKIEVLEKEKNISIEKYNRENIINKTVYKKFYNRFLPLMSVEEWYEGEHIFLPKLLNKKIYFNHLFVYRLGKGTDVYYEPSIPRVKELINYFKKNPNKLKELRKDADFLSKEIKSICKKAKFSDITKLRTIIIEKIWPIITISTVLGLYSSEFGVKKLEKLGIDLRKKSDTLIYKAGWKLLKLAKQKLSNKSKYINYLKFKEIKTGKLPSIKALEKRRQGYIYFNGRLFVGKSLEKLAKEQNIELIDETSEFKDNIIKGTTAMTGKVTGRVKLIFEIPQMEKVKQGDIIVTSMTVPDFLPAMKRAAAFVTDEGGITCHAAIVAREMKKPCIIGTKIATKILKDGDEIEVDADKGVVRIIS